MRHRRARDRASPRAPSASSRAAISRASSSRISARLAWISTGGAPAKRPRCGEARGSRGSAPARYWSRTSASRAAGRKASRRARRARLAPDEREVGPGAEGDDAGRRRRAPAASSRCSSAKASPPPALSPPSAIRPGGDALGEQRLPGGARVLDRGREGGARGRGGSRAAPRPSRRRRASAADHAGVGARRAEAIGAAVQPEEHARPRGRRQPQRRQRPDRPQRAARQTPRAAAKRRRQPLHPRPRRRDRARRARAAASR